MSKEQTTPTIEEMPSVRDTLEEMISLMVEIQDTTVAIQLEDVDRFMHLSFLLATVLQSRTADAQELCIDYCTRYRAQVATLSASNGSMADVFLESFSPNMRLEGGHA